MLDHVALSDCDVVDRWTKAPAGALVQVTQHDKPAVGWRCGLPSGADCLLIVEGDNLGQLLIADVGGIPGPGLDVSRALELMMIEPNISNALPVDFQIGSVVWDGGCLFVETADRNAESTGYACIASAANSRNVGFVYRKITPQFRVAKAIGVRARREPLPMEKMSRPKPSHHLARRHLDDGQSGLVATKSETL